MKEKYFTPHINEIYVGYELEWESKIRNQDWEKTICDVDLISIIYDEFEHADFEESFEEQFRTPYLTKEQIESEGWKLVYNDSVGDSEEFSFEYKNYLLQFYPNRNNNVSIYKYSKDKIFKGNIKCINQFRNILKYLLINP